MCGWDGFWIGFFLFSAVEAYILNQRKMAREKLKHESRAKK
jgi:phosphate/sulfate permease